MICSICCELPRSFWLGEGYWSFLFGEKLCPSCFFWARYRMGLIESHPVIHVDR